MFKGFIDSCLQCKQNDQRILLITVSIASNLTFRKEKALLQLGQILEEGRFKNKSDIGTAWDVLILYLNNKSHFLDMKVKFFCMEGRL